MYVTNSKWCVGMGIVLCLLCLLFLSACGKGASNRLTENDLPVDTVIKDADLSFLSGKTLLYLARMQDEVLCYVTGMPDIDEKTACFYAPNTKRMLREVALSEKANYFYTDGVRLFAVDQFDGTDGRIYQYTVSDTEDMLYSYTEGIRVLPELESEFRWQDTVTGKWHYRFENKLVTMNAIRQNFLFRSIGEASAQTYLVDLLTGEKRVIKSLSGGNMPIEILAFSDENMMIHLADDDVVVYTLKNLNGDVINQWTYARSGADGGKTSGTTGSFLVIYDRKSYQSPSGTAIIINCADGAEKTITFQSAAESQWVKVSPDGAFVLTYDHDRQFSLYNVNSGKCVKTFTVQNVEPGVQVDAVHFDTQGREIYIQIRENNVLGVTIVAY